jgi:hypothetical protein
MLVRLHKQWSVYDLPKSGRPRTARSHDNRQRLTDTVPADPSTPIRMKTSRILEDFFRPWVQNKP